MIRSSTRFGWSRAAYMVLAVAAMITSCQTVEEMPFTKIAPEVLDALRASERAEVLVSLRPPDGYGEPGADLAVMKREIARSQDDVLAALGSDYYRNRIRFDAIPGLAGTVLDMGALPIFEAHPLVEQVSLDTGGVGH
jgi:hypothetical protein